MTEPISEEMSPLWYIYNDGFPDFLAELLEAEELQRLKKVGMHCGCEYSSFPLFRVLLALYEMDSQRGSRADRMAFYL